MTNLPAVMPEGFETGLEDFEPTDAVIPRLKILQKDGLIQDNLSGEKYTQIELIILGLTKQRVLWHPTIEDGEMPMCKSPDNRTGFVNLDSPRKRSFPWQVAGFNPDDFPPADDGLVGLPCSGCHLKDWGTHPAGKTPYCSEQWTLAVLFDGEGDGAFSPAIFTLQRSGLKAIRSFLTTYTRQQIPAFVHVSSVTFKVLTRGDVDYSVPTFVKIRDTDKTDWPTYAKQSMSIREYLTRRPVSDEDEVAGPSDNTNTAPVAAPTQQTTMSAPAPQRAPSPAPTPAQETLTSRATAETATVPVATEEEYQAVPPADPWTALEDDDDLPF